MSLLDSLRYRWRVLTRPDAHDRELAEDMEFFVSSEARQREHAAHGAISATDARREANRRFGNATYHREEVRLVSGIDALDVLLHDIRFALRTFRRTPTFTAVAIATLAIGIGANTAIFSAINTLLLRPLPFREPDRLANLALTLPAAGGNPARDNLVWSYPKLAAFREAQTVFSDVAPWFSSQFTIRVGDEAVRQLGEFVDSRYFRALGVTAALGRTLMLDDDHVGAPPLTVLSDELWQWLFNADPSVLGKTIDIDGVTYSIIGVMAPDFGGVSGKVGFWIPILSRPHAWGDADFLNANNHSFLAFGRLAPGVTHEQAAAVARGIAPRLNELYPDRGPPARVWGIISRPLDATRVDGLVRRTLFLLLGAVGMVLLVACANVASLFLVRAASRRGEIAVRLAIGASRGRVVRQLLVESVLLSLLGGVASLAVARVGVAILSAAGPGAIWGGQSSSGVASADRIPLDLTALAFTAVVAIATGVLFGLVPALQATRPSLTDALRSEGAAAPRVAHRVSTRDVLTVLEISLAVVLLAGSGVLLRSLAHLLAVRPGFEAGHVLTMRVNRAPAWSRDSISRFYDVAIDRLRRVPGVTHVALADCAPMSNGCGPRAEIGFLDRSSPATGPGPQTRLHWVTAEWNAVMKVPVLFGRTFAPTDRLDTPHVVVISEGAAREFWPGESAVGRRLTLGNSDTVTVVGVIGDVRFGGLQAEPGPDVYVSYYQQPMSYRMMLHLRTSGDPAAVTAAARSALREVAPGFPVYDVATMEMRIGADLAQSRLIAQLLSFFAVLALALATIGTYGVISYAVAQRTREMGVRIALGATRRDVIRLVVGRGVALAAAGAVVGLIGALAATRMIRAQLYGVQPADPVTLGGILVVLMLAVVAASWIPARRAAGVPAIHALRGG